MVTTAETVAGILEQRVFIRGSDRPFGELTTEDVLSRAGELRAATGWGPTARVAAVALAWRELGTAMQRASVETVAEVDGAQLVELAPKMWVVLPGSNS